eukprot:gnl/Spiro4/9984_TR5309_c0_g1_i1.p1 gnl/Spiro4/9984_TR5309_c0_g1~~gnl/Spiro4/9984_TR5309_c0_g1_i1.p1  ORF type:complete len:371 (-),score=91.93 gnl/Spiro4/9984_TR5309_c0_g1_i1:43-1122(-)
MTAQTQTPTQTLMERLIAAPKGHLDHSPGESFLLHVFWEAPSHAVALELLAALAQCAAATHRDTPCVPTYFFRITASDDVCRAVPRSIGAHPVLSAARMKIQRGVPAGAVHADLVRRGLDPKLLDMDADAELPPALAVAPVALEFTEVYLDERAFMQHSCSRDFLQAYGTVMLPAMQNIPPQTIRVGTPPASVVERILEPMLHEIVCPLAGCTVWQRPTQQITTSDEASAIFLSLDVLSDTTNDITARIPDAFREQCTTCVAFSHPLRAGTIRLMCVLPSLPPQPLLAVLAAVLQPVRGAAHSRTRDPAAVERIRSALAAAGLGVVAVSGDSGDGCAVGHILHSRAPDLHVSAVSQPPQ